MKGGNDLKADDGEQPERYGDCRSAVDFAIVCAESKEGPKTIPEIQSSGCNGNPEEQDLPPCATVLQNGVGIIPAAAVNSQGR